MFDDTKTNQTKPVCSLQLDQSCKVEMTIENSIQERTYSLEFKAFNYDWYVLSSPIT